MAVAQPARGDPGLRIPFGLDLSTGWPAPPGLLSADSFDRGLGQTSLLSFSPRVPNRPPLAGDPRLIPLPARLGPIRGLLGGPAQAETLLPATGFGRPAAKPTPLAANTANAAAPPDPAEVEAMVELRREQAEQHQRADQAERDNIVWALPALAPVALAAGLEVAGALGAEAVVPQLARPLSFVEREIWQNPALGDAEKTALRELARKKFGRATGALARNLGAEVHHSNPLEFAHLWPRADPNRLANLWALPRATHQIATREWAAFRAGLRGRPPTQAEIMAAKLRIDRMVESQIRRPGLPRPKTPPIEGGSQ